ncbi:MAG TPA: VOC family protein [Candidatus Acidoferrum sp.]|nr:VOC family protein [Candidatus Acidoferrum sp.]
MRLNPHLTFNGECAAAFTFYEQCLHGKITVMMTYGNSPMAAQAPPGQHGKILHATLDLGEQRLTGGDALSDDYRQPQGFSVMLQIAEAAEAERIFKALVEKGHVQVPVQETFWALRFGMLVDQFGTPWMINCGKAT